MKKIVLMTLLVGTSASAQLRTSTIASNMDGMRNARKEMEMRTESTILEKLEEARLEDERNRREQFEGLNFSVHSVPQAQQQMTYPVATETTYVTPVQVVPAEETSTY